jgi:hypothetical protein
LGSSIFFLPLFSTGQKKNEEKHLSSCGAGGIEVVKRYKIAYNTIYPDGETHHPFRRGYTTFVGT